VIVVQGRKCAYLADKEYQFDPENYLVVPVPLPFECETHASPKEPLLTLSFAVDPSMLGEMLLEMDEASLPDTDVVHRGIYTAPLTPEILALGEIGPIQDAPESPEIGVPVEALTIGKKFPLDRFQRARIRRRPGQQGITPGRLKVRNVGAPEIVFRRLVDHMVLAFQMIDGEAPTDRLHVHRFVRIPGRRFAGHAARFESGHSPTNGKGRLI
jgi:hypothetical protein